MKNHDNAKKLIEVGKDPSLEKQKAKALSDRDSANTFKLIALDWYENRKDRWKPRYAVEVITRLENDIFPIIGNYPIKEIDAPVLLAVIRKIEKRGAHELARRQLQKCGEIFRFAIAEGKALRDPLTMGSRGNRELQIYDKILEVETKGNKHWYDVWGLKPKERKDIWRVENMMTGLCVSRAVLSGVPFNNILDIPKRIESDIKQLLKYDPDSLKKKYDEANRRYFVEKL